MKVPFFLKTLLRGHEPPSFVAHLGNFGKPRWVTLGAQASRLPRAPALRRPATDICGYRAFVRRAEQSFTRGHVASEGPAAGLPCDLATVDLPKAISAAISPSDFPAAQSSATLLPIGDTRFARRFFPSVPHFFASASATPRVCVFPPRP